MLQWCSQNTGSCAAVAGDCIRPPMSMWMSLCGWLSTSPKKPSRSAPPKPGSGNAPTYLASDIGPTRSTSRSGSGSPNRPGTNSALGTCSPSTVRVSTVSSTGSSRVSGRSGSE